MLSCKQDGVAQEEAFALAEDFWRALEARRAQEQQLVAARKKMEATDRQSLRAALADDEELRAELSKTRESAAALTTRASKMEFQAQVLSAASGGSTGAGRMGGFCALFQIGACPFDCGKCPRGRHGTPPVPSEEEVLVQITRAKKRLLQQKWADAGGRGELVNAWQVRNPRLELLVRATESEFAESLGQSSDAIDGWHGSAEQNVLSIAVHGFDPKRRSGQAYGAGEYFAKDPNVSVMYAKGGSYMFLCRLLLGQAQVDHTWVDSAKYYVMKQREGRIQALPLFLVQFKPSQGALALRLRELKACDAEDPGNLAARQAGALRPCEARRDAGMDAERTRHIWVGWLAPELRGSNDDAVAEDVEAFLEGHSVAQVVPERNGARVGAFVLLVDPISRPAFQALQKRKYRGQFRISVDDQQQGNPRCSGKVCPRLSGPSHYCRGWNIRGHRAWQWGCPFDHPEDLRSTHSATFTLEDLARGCAKYDEIETELLRSAPFFSADGRCGQPRIVAVKRVHNAWLERAYEERRGFIHDKQGFALERELWHGTNCKAIPELLTHGLQPPSDTRPSEACPRSGGKGLCTTLCGTGCPHCREPHEWHRCHMYGLGVYMADLAQKSHRYVREARCADGAGGAVYSMLRCRVCLGNPYLIEGNLLSPEAMHDVCWCQDPAEALESCSEEWSLAKGHDAFYVRGLAGAQKAGLGVYNSEYILFQPYQILPLYQVDYVLR